MRYIDMAGKVPDGSGLFESIQKTNKIEWLPADDINTPKALDQIFLFDNANKTLANNVSLLLDTTDVKSVLDYFGNYLVTKYANKWNGIYKGFIITAPINERSKEIYQQTVTNKGNTTINSTNAHKVSAYDSSDMVNDDETDVTNNGNNTNNQDNSYTKQILDNSLIQQNMKFLTDTNFYDIIMSDIRHTLLQTIYQTIIKEL